MALTHFIWKLTRELLFCQRLLFAIFMAGKIYWNMRFDVDACYHTKQCQFLLIHAAVQKSFFFLLCFASMNNPFLYFVVYSLLLTCTHTRWRMHKKVLLSLSRLFPLNFSVAKIQIKLAHKQSIGSWQVIKSLKFIIWYILRIKLR